ncbi:hypothetical protein Tco_1088086 [Tanacetum coccineum]
MGKTISTSSDEDSFQFNLGVLNKLAISKIFRTCSIASSVFPPKKVFLPLLVSYYDLEPDIVLAFIEGINVVDRNGCDIFSALKLPFGVSKRSEHFCIATPSHDRERRKMKLVNAPSMAVATVATGLLNGFLGEDEKGGVYVRWGILLINKDEDI